MPKVSIIIPVYNGAKYIGEAIEGVLSQSYKDWELIIVDDGSTDDTENVVAHWGNHLKYLKQPNCGPSAARNLGLKNATGEYIAFLDADDKWNFTFLATAISELENRDPSVIGVCTGWVYLDSKGTVLPYSSVSRKGYLSLYDFLTQNPCTPSAVVVRKEPVMQSGGFDEKIFCMEDWDLWLRLTASGGQFYAIENCLTQYRIHGQNSSRQMDKMRAGRLMALEKLFGTEGLHPNIQKLKPWVYGRALTQNSVELYAENRDSEALHEFCGAIKLYPELLIEEETLYAVVCAQQPVGYKSTGDFLDLTSSEERLVEAVRASLQVVKVAHPKLAQKVYSKAYLVLGHLAYRQRRMSLARYYAYLAVKSDFGCLYHSDVLRLLAKSAIGAKGLDFLKYLKEHALVKLH